MRWLVAPSAAGPPGEAAPLRMTLPGARGRAARVGAGPRPPATASGERRRHGRRPDPGPPSPARTARAPRGHTVSCGYESSLDSAALAPAWKRLVASNSSMISAMWRRQVRTDMPSRLATISSL